jgi:hypothetical protein
MIKLIKKLFYKKKDGIVEQGIELQKYAKNHIKELVMEMELETKKNAAYLGVVKAINKPSFNPLQNCISGSLRGVCFTSQPMRNTQHASFNPYIGLFNKNIFD